MTVSDHDLDELIDNERLARRTKVMFLRNGGATWAQIAKMCEVTEATCRKDYSVVCRDINNEQPANVVARHRAVIFDIQRSMYPRMMQTGDHDAAVKAAATILRALERESKLLGLDQPVRILAAVSTEDFANEAARLIDHIQNLDADTLKEITRGRNRPERQRVIDAEPVGPDQAGDPGAGPDTAPPAPQAGDSDAGGPDVDPGDDDWSNIGD